MVYLSGEKATKQGQRHVALVAAIMIALNAMANAAMSQSNAPDQPTLPDPVPGQGVNLPASIATSDTAYGGPPKFKPNVACSAFNPCAFIPAITADASHVGKTQMRSLRRTIQGERKWTAASI